MGEYPFCRSVPNCGMGIGIRPWQIRRIKCYSLPINLSSWSALQRIHFDSRAVSQLVGIVICSKWPCDLAHPVIRRNVAQCHSRRRWLGESDHRTTQLRRSWCVRLEILTSRTSRPGSHTDTAASSPLGSAQEPGRAAKSPPPEHIVGFSRTFNSNRLSGKVKGSP